MLTHEKQRLGIDKTVAKLQEARFFGKLILQFRDGNWVMTFVEQTALPESLSNKDCLIVVEGEQNVSETK